MTAQDVVERALALVDAPFRLHGRDPATGLDCIGVAAWALRVGDAPTGYRYGSEARRWTHWLADRAFRPVETAQAADLILAALRPRRHHLMVCVPGGHVHAHAGLGRVVLMSDPSPWPAIAAFRHPILAGAA